MLLILFLFIKEKHFYQSNEIWKKSLKMIRENDSNYLPIVPIFYIARTDRLNKYVYCDAITDANISAFNSTEVIENLNENKNRSDIMDQLIQLCNRKISHACLIIGRIHEFGSYNFPENLTLAYSYYLKAHKFGSKDALPLLSYFHRHFVISLSKSVVESDLALNQDFYVESAVPAALQYDLGILRPKSSYRANKFLKILSKATSTMYRFTLPSSYNLKEAKSHYLKKIDKILSLPYLNKLEINQSLEYILAANENQDLESIPIFILLCFDGCFGTNFDKNNIYDFLKEGISSFKDPLLYYLRGNLKTLDFSSFSSYLINDFYKSAQLGYPPAFHRLGYFHEKGYYNIRKNQVKAFKYYSNAEILGYLPSTYKKGKMLAIGKGSPQNFSKSNLCYWKTLNNGPLTEFLYEYSKHGSKSAFIKMIDMNIIFEKEIHFQLNNKSLAKQIYDRQTYSKIPQNVINKMRLANQGNESAIVWLILKLPLNEALDWDRKLQTVSPIYGFINPFLKTYLFTKFFILKFKHNLSYEEEALLSEQFNLIARVLSIFFFIFILIVLIFIRFSSLFL